MDQVTVQETKTVITVKDQDSYPVTITNSVVGVSAGDNKVSLVTKSGDAITIQDAEESITIQEKKETIQPVFREVLQVIKEITTPTEEEIMYKEEIDFVGETLVYRGWADAGSLTNAASWRIRRTQFVGAEGDVVHDWADGNTNFDNIWDNRLSLSYS